MLQIKSTFILLCFLILNYNSCFSQNSKGVLSPTFEVDSNLTLEKLNISLFTTLLENDYKFIQELCPSYGLLDSFLKQVSPALNHTTRKIKHAQIIGKFKGEYKRFRKKIRKSDFVLGNSILDSTTYGSYNLQDSIPFCEITMHCSRKGKLFEIDYQAMYILGQWCVVNKLYFYNLRKVKKKKG